MPSSSLCDSEFPSLQTATRLTKGSKNKCRDASLKDSSAAVFRDRYIAELRDSHGANMRAVEAAEEDESYRFRRCRSLDPDTVNDLMEDMMRQIAEEGELVTKEKVRREAECR